MNVSQGLKRHAFPFWFGSGSLHALLGLRGHIKDKVMKFTPSCSCSTRNGSQCGRKVTDGSQPPICHVHRLQQQGKGSSPLIPTEVDEISILKRLARDTSPQIRLRAVDILLSMKSGAGCERCASEVSRAAELDQVLLRATQSQRLRLRDLVAEVKAIKAAALAQPVSNLPE